MRAALYRAIALAFLCFPANAASYYVDAKVAQSGDGTSWTQAWKTFSDITYSALQPGDTVNISGGTYTSPLIVSRSGAVGQRIRFVQATEAGHESPAIIDGRNSVDHCVRVSGYSYVSIENLTIRNCTMTGVKFTSATDVVASGNIIYALSRGVDLWRVKEALVQGNTITGPTWDTRQNDGIFGSEGVGNSYLDNHITISNSEPNGHDDGIQSYWDRDLTISGNYVEQKNNKTINAQGIFITRPSGLMKVTNNVVVGLKTYQSHITLSNMFGSTGALHAEGNILVGSKWGVVHIEHAPASVIRNNSLHSVASGSSGVFIVGTSPPAANINRNGYYIPNGVPAFKQAVGSYSWTQWRALGYETHGYNIAA